MNTMKNTFSEPRTVSDTDIAANLKLCASKLTGLQRENPENPELWQHLVALTVAYAMEIQKRLESTRERLAHLERLSTTDELTGLLNRRGFEERFRQEMASARRLDEGGVLIFIDLDGFKPINDTFGHDAGDEVLRQVANLLRANVREGDSLGPVGRR